MPLQQEYPIPSATELTCLTETQIEALRHPAKKKVEPKRWVAKTGERILPITRLPGFFITDHGRLLHQHTKNNGRTVQRELRGSIVNGHRVAVISGKLTLRFAREMLKAFDPRKRTNYLRAVPLDGNPLNLKLENWQWMSPKQEAEHRKQSGEIPAKLKTQTVQGRYGPITRRTKYSAKDIEEMKRLLLAEISVNRIAEIFNSPESYIVYVKKQLKKKPKKDEG